MKTKMKKAFIITSLALLMGISASAQSVLGKWRAGTDSGACVIEIYQSGGVYNGKIVWLEESVDKDGKPVKDVNNPDKSLRDRPLLGLNLLSDLKPDGKGGYKDGKIYDPEGGKTYRCSMRVENGVLKVSGHVGPFHRTMDWPKAE